MTDQEPERLARRVPGRPLPRVVYVSGERWADQIRRVLSAYSDGGVLDGTVDAAAADLTAWAILAGDARYHQGQVMATPLVQRYRNALEEIAGAGPRPDGGILRDRAVSALDGTQPAPQSPGRGETPP
jgi:hypothetical protein